MHDFNPKEVFDRIDLLGKKSISIDDLRLFLDENGVVYSYQLLKEVIKTYSKTKQTFIRYNE